MSRPRPYGRLNGRTLAGAGELPLYSYDYDANYPKVALEFKESIAAADAVLFVTPQHPGLLQVAAHELRGSVYTALPRNT